MAKKVEPIELSDWTLKAIRLDIEELEAMYGFELGQLDIDRIVTRAVSVATSHLISTNLDKKNAHTLACITSDKPNGVRNWVR